MATFYTDPSIALRGLREPESISDLITRFAQLRALAGRERLLGLEEKTRQVQLRELERQMREDEALRGAFAQGNVPGRTELPIFGGTMGQPAQGPSLAGVTEGGFDPQRVLAALSGGAAAHRIPDVQQGFASQQAELAKQRLDFATKIQDLDNKRLDAAGKISKQIGDAALTVMSASPEVKPRIYAGARQRLIEAGVVPPNALPEQYTPDLDPMIEAQATQADDYWKLVQAEKDRRTFEETTRHGRTMERLTERGQTLTDLRARELAELTRQERKEAREEKVTLKREEAEARVASQEGDLDRLAEAARDLKTHPGLHGAVGFRIGTQFVPGTKAASFRAQLDTLKSQIAFGALQKMREMSKTGGALGQVSNIELGLLQNNVAAISENLREKEFKASLDKIISYAADAKGRLRAALGKSEVTPPPRGGPQVGTVEDGYRFKGGDPANPANWEKAK